MPDATEAALVFCAVFLVAMILGGLLALFGAVIAAVADAVHPEDK